MNKQFSKEEIQATNSHMKENALILRESLILREMQIKATLSFHLTLTGLEKLTKKGK